MKIFNYLLNNTISKVYLNHSDYYPTPINLSYLWGFGSLAGMVLVSQIITGILLAMHYNAHIEHAFSDLEHIMRDVIGGYGLRYMHLNGASMFFIVVYLHIARGLYYGSYFQPRMHLWFSGIAIFFLMMATAFMGYVLPWGQMSFWGATVITNLFSAIPIIGDSVVQWLWGGFSVDNPTLNRFFSIHFFVPFLIVGLVGLHLVLLHEHGSNNPLGITINIEKIPFFSYFWVKDLFGMLVFSGFFAFIVVNVPNVLGHPDNYIEAQPLVTPTHIVPEWYFLPFYAILRSVPDKLGGVILMVFAILIWFMLPFIDKSPLRSSFFKPLHQINFITFIGIAISLGWVGQEIVEYPFINFSIFVTILYFMYYLSHVFYINFFKN